MSVKVWTEQHTILCVTDADRWGFWCKTCTPADEIPDVQGNHRCRDSARRDANRHEKAVHS